MKAKEAREKADKINVNKSISSYPRISDSIEKAAKRGQYRISFQEVYNPIVRMKLIHDGYNVEWDDKPYPQLSLLVVTW